MPNRTSPGADGGGTVGGQPEVTVYYPGRYSVAGIVRVGAAGEDGRDDPPVLVDGGAARVARPHVDAEAGDDALHRATVVGVAGGDGFRLPRAGRLDVEWAVFGKPDHGGGFAALGRRKTQRGQAETVDAQNGYVVLPVEYDDLCRQAPSRSPDLHTQDRLPSNDVGVGDNQVPARDPARALHAVAAGYARHAQRTRARRPHVGIPDDASLRADPHWRRLV